MNFFFFLGGGGIMTNGLKQSLTRECCKRILDYGLKWGLINVTGILIIG